MEPGTDLVCGPENVREFNAALRQAAPECLELIRALRAEGLLDGLRGARLMSLDVANARQAADAPRTVSGHQIITHTLFAAPSVAPAGQKRGRP